MKIVLRKQFSYATSDTLKNVYTLRAETNLGQYNLFYSLDGMYFGYKHNFLKKLVKDNYGMTVEKYNEFIFFYESNIKNFSKTLIKYELFMVRK